MPACLFLCFSINDLNRFIIYLESFNKKPLVKFQHPYIKVQELQTAFSLSETFCPEMGFGCLLSIQRASFQWQLVLKIPRALVL